MEPGGLWDANNIKIVARWIQEGQVMGETDLKFSGEVSHYVGSLKALHPGRFTLQVLAMDPGNANFGSVSEKITVKP